MRPVIRYQADDGTLFISQHEAEKRDVLNARVDEALSGLVKHPGNHDGYIQQRRSAVLYCREVAVEISEIEQPSTNWRKYPAEDINAMSVSRILDSNAVAMRLWRRLSCIDEAYREWGQPFFVLNPDKRVMIDLKGVKRS